MKISEYIVELEKIKKEIGDVDVQREGVFGRESANPPTIRHELILKGRESKPRFWFSFEGEDRKGNVVCKI